MDALDLDLMRPISRRVTAAERALRLAVLAGGLMAASLAVLFVLVRLCPPSSLGGAIVVPFAITSGALVVVSYAFRRATANVRRERQRPFRSWLLVGLGGGIVFATVQMYGLLGILPEDRNVFDSQTGVRTLFLAITAMHAIHVAIAMLLTCRVVVEAFCDRYDHEYYWGVYATEMFWHCLLIGWGCVLVVAAVAGKALAT